MGRKRKNCRGCGEPLPTNPIKVGYELSTYNIATKAIPFSEGQCHLCGLGTLRATIEELTDYANKLEAHIANEVPGEA